MVPPSLLPTSPLVKKEGNETSQELQLNPGSNIEGKSISARTVLRFRSFGNSTGATLSKQPQIRRERTLLH